MGKASRKKSHIKVKARRNSMGFTTAIVAIVVLGVAGIALSRGSGEDSADAPGVKIGDHWHSAVGVNLCGTWQPNIPPYEAATGIHSHGDGLIHLHPYSSAGAGKNAKVGLYFKQADDKISATELDVGGQKFENGDICENLDNKPGEVRWSVNGVEQAGNPADYVPNDRDVVAIAFLPKDVEIGTPPSAGVAPTDQ